MNHNKIRMRLKLYIITNPGLLKIRIANHELELVLQSLLQISFKIIVVIKVQDINNKEDLYRISKRVKILYKYHQMVVIN